jgi:CO/xanthine dehydrogenase Mo-binding subunit
VTHDTQNTPARAYTVIGTRPPRYDAAAKVAGRALYGPDVTLPGSLHAQVLRSPHAHARIRSIDVSRAASLPNVYAVVTAKDLPSAQDDTQRQHALDNTLASDKVLYVGHPVAAVAARDAHTAEQALRLIEVVYEVLPAVVDVLEAAQPGAPLLHEKMTTRSLAGPSAAPSNLAYHFQHLKGDPEQGFAQADVIVERDFRSATVHQGYLEPHAATASWETDGRLSVYCTTQGSFAVRRQLHWLLDIPVAKISVHPTEVGGAFGGKNEPFVECVAALLAQKSGRPVKIVMNRAEVFLASGPTSGTAIHVKAGATRDGRITAIQAELYYEAGAYPGSPVGSGANLLFGPYDIPNGQIDGYDVVVNKPKTGSYRAPGGTPANWAGESVIDELADRIGLDPLEFRMLNRAQEGTRTIGGSTYAHIGSKEVLQAAQEHPHYRSALPGSEHEHCRRGRGVAFGHWGNWGAESSSTISVNVDGTVALTTGSVDITGTRTTLAMQVAEVLGLAVDQVSSTTAGTDSIGFSQVSAGSRTTVATGHAVVQAAHDVIAQMRTRAAQVWDVETDTVRFDAHARDGPTFFVDPVGGGPTLASVPEPLSFAELAAMLDRTGGPITGVGNVNVREWGGAFGAHIVDVEVDVETAKVTLLRYTAVQDVGTAVHPTQVEGQIQGGTAQGIGWALYEGYQYDEQGRMLNPTLLDYKLPTVLDVPPIEAVIVEVPYPKHPFGLRGVGEMPILPPPAAIANAIYRAVGIRADQLPMTPAHILDKLGVL